MSDEKKENQTEEEIQEDVVDEVESQEEEVVEEDSRSEEEKLQDALDEAKAETLKYKDEYLRTHADFDNSKKRLEREKATAVAYANESFAGDMLGVLDSFDSALASVEQSEEGGEAIAKFKEGLELTYEQMLKALKRNGVEEISTDGDFNPDFHQAVMQVESEEHENGQIVQSLQKGYKMKDRLLRAAMVSTAK